MKRALILFLLLVATGASANRVRVFPFRLGEWTFQLSCINDGPEKPVSVLSAVHVKRKVYAEATLDYRWYVLVESQTDRNPKAVRPLLEALVGFAASEWEAQPGSADVLAAMRAAPPTEAYRRDLDILRSKPK